MSKYPFLFLWLCIKHAFRRSLKVADAIYGGIGLTLIFGAPKLLGYNVTPPSDVKTAIECFIVILASVWALRFVTAPYFLWMQQREELQRVKRIDDDDLEHLLYGAFIGDTFLYKAEITLCKEYKGKFEIGQLRDVFTRVKVRAPKQSWAAIRFQLFNGRQNPDAKCYFYVLAPDGKSVFIENIYEDQNIYLDRESCFSFKLAYDDSYIVHDEASLRITVSSWTK